MCPAFSSGTYCMLVCTGSNTKRMRQRPTRASTRCGRWRNSWTRTIHSKEADRCPGRTDPAEAPIRCVSKFKPHHFTITVPGSPEFRISRSNFIFLKNSKWRQIQKTKKKFYYLDDDDITPYATFTLKPINGMDTTRSLMSVPSVRGPDSHSSNSIEGTY